MPSNPERASHSPRANSSQGVGGATRSERRPRATYHRLSSFPPSVTTPSDFLHAETAACFRSRQSHEGADARCPRATQARRQPDPRRHQTDSGLGPENVRGSALPPDTYAPRPSSRRVREPRLTFFFGHNSADEGKGCPVCVLRSKNAPTGTVQRAAPHDSSSESGQTSDRPRTGPGRGGLPTRLRVPLSARSGVRPAKCLYSSVSARHARERVPVSSRVPAVRRASLQRVGTQPTNAMVVQLRDEKDCLEVGIGQ